MTSSSDSSAPRGLPGLPSALALAALLVALALLVAHALHFDFLNDDAFISFRYADNLARHGELTYNLGERVEGYTNFLWTMILAGVIAVGGDPVPWSKGLGVALSCGTLVGLFAFSRWWASRLDAAEGGGRHAAWAALAPVLLALNPAFAAWSEGGLETALFTLLATLGIVGYLFEELGDRRFGWSGSMMALAAMTRPEGLLMFGLLGLHMAANQLVVERRIVPPLRRVTWVASFVGLYAPYWIWRFLYYGFPFPNTYYAKGDGALWEPGLRYVGSFVADYHLWILLPLLFARWPGARREGFTLSAILAVVLPYLVYVARVGGDFMALHRFLVPLLPVLFFLVQESVAGLWSRYARGGLGAVARGRAILVGVTVLALLAWTNFQMTERSLEIGSDRGVDSIGWLKNFVVQTTAIGKHLAANHPPETSIATTAAGTIPYYSRMRTLDLLCLNDTYTAHTVAASGGRPGHAKSAPEPYVLKWKPDILIWHPRMSGHVPRPRGGESRYWGDRGYRFGYAKVEGLDPPYWSYFERDKSAP